MTPQQIGLVQSSFAILAPHTHLFAPTFYARLFELDPELRAMFPTDLTEQGTKLTQMIAVVVQGLDKLDTLIPAIRGLGERHQRYGVTPAHYQTVGGAVLWTLERLLGDAMTSELRLAWSTAYGTLAGQMLRGANAEPQQRVA